LPVNDCPEAKHGLIFAFFDPDILHLVQLSDSKALIRTLNDSCLKNRMEGALVNESKRFINLNGS
jgi:hypothetical protein